MAVKLVTFKELRPKGIPYTRDHIRYKEQRVNSRGMSACRRGGSHGSRSKSMIG